MVLPSINNIKISVSDRNASQQFLYKENQRLMRSLTRVTFKKVFEKKPTPDNKAVRHILTTAEVKEKFGKAIRRARWLLQMPPIVPIESDKIEIISNNGALQGLDDSKFVFTDITFTAKDKERTIVVRQPDGKLETASPDTRRRMNQIYYPVDGRSLIVPKMFEGEHLKRCLDEQKYEFILDRACLQFEPYDKNYHRVTTAVYEHINKNNQFDCLRSTRHFGPMAFFLAWHQLIDNLLVDSIRRGFFRNGVEIICLSHNLNKIPYDHYVLQQLFERPVKNDQFYYEKFVLSEGNFDKEQEILKNIEKTVGKTTDDLKLDEICLTFIEEYANTRATKKNEIKVAITSSREENIEKQRLLEGLQKAHGVS